MARKHQLPTLSGPRELETTREYELETVYPKKPVVPPPSRWLFRNVLNEKRIRSYDGVVKAASDLAHTFADHQRALARVDNVEREIVYDRETTEYNIDRIRHARKQFQPQPEKKKKGKVPKNTTTLGITGGRK